MRKTTLYIIYIYYSCYLCIYIYIYIYTYILIYSTPADCPTCAVVPAPGLPDQLKRSRSQRLRQPKAPATFSWGYDGV